MRYKSERRKQEEKEYKRICKEIDLESIESGDTGCFFCGVKVKNAIHHHLDGRSEHYLKKEWIVRGHDNCHRSYHDQPVDRLPWFDSFLLRLKQKDFTLYEREKWKLSK